MPKPLVLGLIAAFLVADVILGVVVWRHVHREPARTDLPASPYALPSTTVTNSASNTPSSDFDSIESALATMFDTAEDGTMVVASAGACTGAAPVVRVSRDGGGTFTVVTPDVRGVLAVNAEPGGRVSVVAADDACNATAYGSEDGGSTWDELAAVEGWYRDPESPEHVRFADARSHVGCPVVSLSGIDRQTARVTCANGTARRLDSAGAAWTKIPSIQRARAVSFASASSGIALVVTEDCPVAALTTSDGGTEWAQQGCLAGNNAEAVLDQGSRIFALVDGGVLSSTDAGKTWSVPGPQTAANPDDSDEDTVE